MFQEKLRMTGCKDIRIMKWRQRARQKTTWNETAWKSQLKEKDAEFLSEWRKLTDCKKTERCDEQASQSINQNFLERHINEWFQIYTQKETL